MCRSVRTITQQDSGRSIHLYRSTAVTILALTTLVLILISPVAAQQDLSPIPGLLPAAPANLTDAERAWVSENPVVSVCIDPAYTPIEFRDSSGAYTGLALDYLERVGESTGLRFRVQAPDTWNVCIDQIQNKKTDLLSAVYISDLRKDYLLFSRPYYKNSLVIVTKTSAPSGLALENLDGKSVAVVDGYTSHLLLTEQYPDINAVPVADVKTGLTKVAFGSADAYLGDLATVTYVVEKEGITNLKVSGEYAPSGAGPLQFAFGVRNDRPVLVSVLNKGIAAISPEDNAVIMKRWISSSLTPSAGMDTHLLLSLLVMAVIILIIVVVILLLNRALKRQVASKTADLVRELEQRRVAEQALRESENRNVAILAAIPDLLFILSREGQYLDFRASDNRLLTLTPDTIIGSSIRNAGLDEHTTQEILNAIGKALDSGCLEYVSYELVVSSDVKSFEARLIRLDADRVLGIVQDVTERKRMQKALQLARSKMGLLNLITFQDIQAGIFSLAAYVELMKKEAVPDDQAAYLEKMSVLLKRLSGSLKFAQDYQDLGITPPRWQNVQQVFLFAISHLDFLEIGRKGSLDGVEIYADPLLERAFFSMMESLLVLGAPVTEITLGYTETGAGLVMTIGGNGAGIFGAGKEMIFERESGKTHGPGLYLVQQIISITGITIRENGEPGQGIRFEILVPKGGYRFFDKPHGE
ncbi:transporter substrate-binding domain-containing protein [Methanoregula sp.]|uniref:transporter substrate-binding domain-containing protein n=1 Tax=Methanoregula sp. TaxID=2052170 RepID=UPI0035636C63